MLKMNTIWCASVSFLWSFGLSKDGAVGRYPVMNIVSRLATIALTLILVGAGAEAAADKPNVLFVAIDDLNDWIGSMGGRDGMHTPNFDRLARRGVLFTNAHCAAPACNPSRVAVMTGVRPSSSGVYRNMQPWRSSPRLKDAVTLPEHFRANGYEVYGGGKIFHALCWITDGYGKQRNDPAIWDRYFPSKVKPMPDAIYPLAANAKRAANGYVNWRAVATPEGRAEGRPSHFFDFAPILEQSAADMADAKVVDWAIAELGKDSDKPFFHAVGIYRPHIPWHVPKKYFDLYPLDAVELPKVKDDDLDDCSENGIRSVRRGWHKWLVENDQWRAAVQGYCASISFADAQLGRLVDALDSSRHADNTVIVLWSDHGMHIGEKEQWEKFTLWEESTRVPLMVVSPRKAKLGTICKQPASLVDIYPTLIELCSLPARADLDGTSLVPQLQDPDVEREQPAITTWGRGNHAIRTLHWRYIRHANGEEELYDHRSDPDEFTNLARKEPVEYRATMDRLARWLPATNAAAVPVE